MVKVKGAGRNTESFDPKSTIVRPDMRVLIGQPEDKYSGFIFLTYYYSVISFLTVRYDLGQHLKHDDVLIVPNFFCEKDDWSIYYKLIEEMRELQSKTKCVENSRGNKPEWISWHEGAHLITKDPAGSATFKMLTEKISTYLNIKHEKIGTRFNWYTYI